MANRFSKYMQDLLPRTGRIIAEDGTTWNQANTGQFNDRYNLLNQTINNGAVQITRRTTVLSADSLDPLYYYLDIPPGRRYLQFQQSLALTEGRYLIDLVQFPSGVTGGVAALKATLSQSGESSVQTNIMVGVTPVVPGEAIVVSELALVDSGIGIGSAVSQSASASEGVLKTFNGSTEPTLIRVLRDTAGDYIASFGAIAWEEDEA